MSATSPSFSRLMLDATYALQAAYTAATTDLERAQARAAGKLAGVTFHRISTAHPDHKDAASVRSDLEHIWESVDPLISAIGAELSANFHGVDLELFENQVRGALEGNATHECDRVEAIAIEERYGDVLPRYGIMLSRYLKSCHSIPQIIVGALLGIFLSWIVVKIE